MSSTGRPCSSTSRDATMPITPGCHPSSASTMPCVASRSSASMSSRARASVLRSTSWRWRLSSSSSRAIAFASCSILRHQQLDAAQRVAEPADRVEARREDEADAAGGERLALEPRRANERAQPLIRGLLHHLEPEPREHAILSAQRRDVGDRRERDEIEHAVHRVLVAAQRARECERELERDAHRSEILVRVLAAVLLRIEHRETRRQRTARQVMIGDDDVDPRLARDFDGRERVRAAVAGDEHLRARCDGGVHAGEREVVAVLDAPRDERNRIAAEPADGAEQHGGGRHAVHIVVAVHHDALAAREWRARAARRRRPCRACRRDRGAGRDAGGDSASHRPRVMWPRRSSSSQMTGGRWSSLARAATATASGAPGSTQRDGGRVRAASAFTTRKLSSPEGSNKHHPAAYRSTPHASHTSIARPAAIALRRCIGIAVSQRPHACPRSG